MFEPFLLTLFSAESPEKKKGASSLLGVSGRCHHPGVVLISFPQSSFRLLLFWGSSSLRQGRATVMAHFVSQRSSGLTQCNSTLGCLRDATLSRFWRPDEEKFLDESVRRRRDPLLVLSLARRCVAMLGLYTALLFCIPSD